ARSPAEVVEYKNMYTDSKPPTTPTVAEPRRPIFSDNHPNAPEPAEPPMLSKIRNASGFCFSCPSSVGYQNVDDWYMKTNAPIRSEVWSVTQRRSLSNNRARDKRRVAPDAASLRCSSSQIGLSGTRHITPNTIIAGTTPAHSMMRHAHSGRSLMNGYPS